MGRVAFGNLSHSRFTAFPRLFILMTSINSNSQGTVDSTNTAILSEVLQKNLIVTDCFKEVFPLETLDL